MYSPTWSVRAETPADVPRIRAVNEAAFPSPDEADLVDALRSDPAWTEGLSRVVEGDDGRVIGHALLTRCHIGEAPALCLAPCAVVPEVQGLGAGQAVIADLLREARRRGESAVVVLGHPGYYPRFGFQPAGPRGISLSVEVPEDALMALSLDGTELPVGTVKYAAPFGI